MENLQRAAKQALPSSYLEDLDLYRIATTLEPRFPDHTRCELARHVAAAAVEAGFHRLSWNPPDATCASPLCTCRVTRDALGLGQRIIADGRDHFATLDACHAHIRHLRHHIEQLELAAELNPIRGDRPYKVLGYHRAKVLSRDHDPAVYAEFRTLPEAVEYCAQQIDHQIAHAIAEAEAGVLTTPRQIDDAIAELMITGWYFWVSNVVDPSARDAFVCEIYARALLKQAVMRKRRGDGGKT